MKTGGKLRIAGIALVVLLLFLILDSSAITTLDPHYVEGTTYKCESWSNEKYPLINLYGENHVPLHTNSDPFWNSRVNKLAKLVLDSDDNFIVKIGEKRDLGEGYTLEFHQTSDSEFYYLTFSRNGQYINNVYPQVGDWDCSLDNIEGENSIVVLKVHVSRVDWESGAVEIDGIWLIDYENARTLNIGDDYEGYPLKEIVSGLDESNPGALVFSINKLDNTTTTLTSSPNPPTFGQSVTFTATVSTISSGEVEPSGKVTFMDGETVMGSQDLTSGKTTFTTTLPAGQHSITAQYSGDLDFKPSTSAVLRQTVSLPTPTITWNNPADIIFGTALNETQLNAVAADPTTGAPVPGTFNYTPPTGTVLSAGTQTLRVSFTPTDTANYSAATKEVTIKIIPNETPVANFTSSVTQGNAPLLVRFTDLSQNAISRFWDFGDGVNSTQKNPVHTYTNPGVYIVNLTVTTASGTNFNTTTITVSGNDSSAPVLPVADFNANPASGPAPLTVQFTDLSQNAISRSWDFNGDGISDSSDPNPTYTYNTSGTYTVSLTVSNANGTVPKTASITVQEGSSNSDETSSSSSSSSGGGGGGGGGGGSPESQSNVAAKELSQAFVTSGKPAKFEFPRNTTCVVYVSFDAKKTLGKVTTTVEMLKGKSSLVSDLPAGEVYKSFNVWVGNGGVATSKNIDNPALCFKVEKSWLQKKNVDPASITLNWYNGKKWEQLPVKLIGEDSQYLYFTANVPTYSSFAITGKVKNAPQQQKTSGQQEGSLPGIGDKKTSDDANATVNKTTNTKSTPGFETLTGIVCLLGVFFFDRKRIR